jgi:hypothetical protein
VGSGGFADVVGSGEVSGMRVVRFGVQVNNVLDGIKVLVVDKEDVSGRYFPGYLYEGDRYFFWDTFTSAKNELVRALTRGYEKKDREIFSTKKDLEYLVSIRAEPVVLGAVHENLCSLCELREKYYSKIIDLER